jgi:hypothetical protein
MTVPWSLSRQSAGEEVEVELERDFERAEREAVAIAARLRAARA